MMHTFFSKNSFINDWNEIDWHGIRLTERLTIESFVRYTAHYLTFNSFQTKKTFPMKNFSYFSAVAIVLKILKSRSLFGKDVEKFLLVFQWHMLLDTPDEITLIFYSIANIAGNIHILETKKTSFQYHPGNFQMMFSLKHLSPLALMISFLDR